MWAPRAFTLIELLVVVAIVAALAALLLPAVSSVRERAQAARCAGQMRQIGMAIMVYSEHWDGRLPPSRFQGCAPAELGYGMGKTAAWPDEAIVGGEIDGPELMGGLFSGLVFAGPWRCPSDHARQGVVLANGMSYGLNMSLCPYADALIPANFWSRLTPLPQISQPSAMMLMAETQEPRWYWPRGLMSAWPAIGFYNQRTDGMTSWNSPGDHSPNSMWARHQGRANIVFCDGHVASTGDPTSDVAAKQRFVRISDVVLSERTIDHRTQLVGENKL
jgi:prepilin-type processing-associated H-X9-DG protein/prepilin-type N-terminal cleavage/methylation domain-containing protein